MKDALRSSWRAAFSLLLALLKIRRSTGAWAFCHFALALRFVATRRLMSEGKFLAGLRGFLFGVATCAACCRIQMNVVVAVSMSSRVLCVIADFTLSRTTVLYSAQFVCEVCSRGADRRITIVVLMVNMMGVWSDLRS